MMYWNIKIGIWDIWLIKKIEPKQNDVLKLIEPLVSAGTSSIEPKQNDVLKSL